MAEKLVAPAAFLATHVYSPMWLACTDSMDRLLIFLPILLMVISSLDSTSVPLKSQCMEMGESPLITEHCREASSPAFGISSPKEKGIIWGRTERNKCTRKSFRLGNDLTLKNRIHFPINYVLAIF